MRVLPAAERKTLRACKPTDLVRVDFGAGAVLAAVAVDGQQGRICLVILEGRSAVRWIALNDHDLDEHVVCYGRDYCVEADQNELIELRPRSLNSVAGSLVLRGAEWHLCTHVESNGGVRGARHYVWRTGILGSPHPEFELTAFSKWSLYLNVDRCGGSLKSDPLMTFDCQTQPRSG